MNKITKNIITGVACLTLGAAGFMTTRTVMQSQHVSATDPEKVAAEQVTQSFQNRVVHINLSKKLTDKVNELNKSDEKVDVKVLDDLSYYAIQFWSEDAIVVSENNKNSSVLSSEEVLNTLLSMYDKYEYEKSFTINEDSTITVLRDLSKPSNYDSFISEIKEKSEEKVETEIEIDKNQKASEKEPIDVELDVKTELVEE